MFCCDSPWLLILSFMVDWFCSQTTTQLLSVGTTQLLLFFAWYLAKYTFFNTNVPFTSIYIHWTEGAVSYEPIFWREYFFPPALRRYVRHLQISYCTWNALVHKTGVLSPKITHRSRHWADSTPSGPLISFSNWLVEAWNPLIFTTNRYLVSLMVNLVKPYSQMTPVLSKRIALFVIHQVQLIDLLFQWIGWRDDLQETIVFTCLCHEILINLVVYCKCSHNSVQWLCLDCWLDSTHWSSICVLHATAFSSSLQAATSSPGASLFDEPPIQVVIINPSGHGAMECG